MRTYNVKKAKKKKQRRPIEVDYDVWDIVALAVLALAIIFVSVGVCAKIWGADIEYTFANNVINSSRNWTFATLYSRLSTWSGRGFITAARIMGYLAITGVVLLLIERVLEGFITLPKALPIVLAAFTVAVSILAIVFAYVVSVNCYDVLAESLGITEAIADGTKSLSVFPIEGMWLTAVGGVLAGGTMFIKR